MTLYERYLEPVMEHFTTGEYYQEVYAAKQEYFEKAGVVYEDDPEYEQRMCIFIDWYLFDRDLPGVDLPPIKYFFRKNKDQFNSEQLQIYRDFCSTIHSIFRLKRLSWDRQGFVLLDLFTNKTTLVRDSEIRYGFASGDIFEARVIPYKDVCEFSKGFCFHPAEMKRFIEQEVKKVRFQEKARQTKLILQLSAMKLKHLRYPHLSIHQIYRFENRM